MWWVTLRARQLPCSPTRCHHHHPHHPHHDMEVTCRLSCQLVSREVDDKVEGKVAPHSRALTAALTAALCCCPHCCPPAPASPGGPRLLLLAAWWRALPHALQPQLGSRVCWGACPSAVPEGARWCGNKHQA